MGKKTTPKSVTVNKADQTMEIVWADGHESVYGLEGLRKNCPCVICKGGHESMSTAADRSLFLQEPDRYWEINDLKQVGNHALQIFWSDGHSNGMYRWDHLRAMCPCKECYPPEVREAELTH